MLLGACLILSPTAWGKEVLVAVASNFQTTLTSLAEQFENQSPYQVKISVGATGKLYAQILQGAPHEIFLAADQHRPKLLEQKFPRRAKNRFTYAIGQLVLTGDGFRPEASPAGLLVSQRVNRIAIANPRLAPYGEAARQALKKMKIWDSIQTKLVRGENVSQTAQFVLTSNSELGFLALAQIRDLPASRYWLVPQHYHSPIEQQLVQLSDSKAAEAFVAFMRSEHARALIQSQGYKVPDVY